MRRGSRISLVAFVLFLLLLLTVGIIARLLLRPEHVTELVTKAVADAGLELKTVGDTRVSTGAQLAVELNGVRLLLPSGELLAKADVLRVVVPWSSVFARQAVVSRIELLAPAVDVAALDAWLASRPPGDGGLPTMPVLRSGLQVSSGKISNQGEAVLDHFELELDRLQPGEQSELVASARLADGRKVAVMLAAVPVQTSDAIRLDSLNLEVDSDQARLMLEGQFAWQGDTTFAGALGGTLSIGDESYQLQLKGTPRARVGTELAVQATGNGLDLDLAVAPVEAWNWWQALAAGRSPGIALPPITGVVSKSNLVLGPLRVEGLRIESPASQAPPAEAATVQ